MGFFKQKPIIVEAIPFTPQTLGDLLEFLDRHEVDYRIDGEGSMAIKNNGVVVHAYEYDWLVRDEDVVLPVPAATFMRTYDPAPSDEIL